MPRASQYSRLRRVVMQVTMFVVFAATLGLAAMVGNSRDRAASVALSDTAHDAGPLTIQLPRSWSVHEERSGTQAVEPPRAGAPGQRRVVLYEAKSSAGGSSEQLLSNYLERHEGRVGRAKSIEMLGAPGVMAR